MSEAISETLKPFTYEEANAQIDKFLQEFKQGANMPEVSIGENDGVRRQRLFHRTSVKLGDVVIFSSILTPKDLSQGECAITYISRDKNGIIRVGQFIEPAAFPRTPSPEPRDEILEGLMSRIEKDASDNDTNGKNEDPSFLQSNFQVISQGLQSANTEKSNLEGEQKAQALNLRKVAIANETREQIVNLS